MCVCVCVSVSCLGPTFDRCPCTSKQLVETISKHTYTHRSNHSQSLSPLLLSQSLSNNCSINEELDQELLRQLGRTALLHINITKEGKRIPTNNILPAIQDDLSCFGDLQSLLLQLPEEMCGVNPHHLAYMRHRECWNGTDRDRLVFIIITNNLNTHMLQ